jgi:hypothetical protein
MISAVISRNLSASAALALTPLGRLDVVVYGSWVSSWNETVAWERRVVDADQR